MTKTALLPGQAASFRNITSYDNGINGIMVDFNQSHGTVTAGKIKGTGAYTR